MRVLRAFVIGVNASRIGVNPSKIGASPSRLRVNRDQEIGVRPGAESERARPVCGDFHTKDYHTGMLVVKEFVVGR